MAGRWTPKPAKEFRLFVGLFEKNIGTLSDEDGSFELIVPAGNKDSVLFSSIGYKANGMSVRHGRHPLGGGESPVDFAANFVTG